MHPSPRRPGLRPSRGRVRGDLVPRVVHERGEAGLGVEAAAGAVSSSASFFPHVRRSARLTSHSSSRWQARIRGKFPSPLVQPHRKLLLDGVSLAPLIPPLLFLQLTMPTSRRFSQALILTRIVKKTTDYVEVTLPVIEDGDNTITGFKSVVAIECLADPETLSTPLVAVLTSDLLVLCKTQPDPNAPGGKVKTDANGLAKDGTVDLFAVLRMQTKSQPASLMNGSSQSCFSTPLALLFFRSLTRSFVSSAHSPPRRRQPRHPLLRCPIHQFGPDVAQRHQRVVPGVALVTSPLPLFQSPQFLPPLPVLCLALLRPWPLP